MRIATVNGTSGEIDPRMLARSGDVEAVSSGYELARNVILMPYGGAKKRDGLLRAGVLGNFNNVTGVNHVSIVNSRNEHYTVVLINNQCLITQDGVLISMFTTPFTPEQSPDVSFLHELDTVIMFHPQVAPWAITNGTTGNIWSKAFWTFSNMPTEGERPDNGGLTIVDMTDVIGGAPGSVVNAGRYVDVFFNGNYNIVRDGDAIRSVDGGYGRIEGSNPGSVNSFSIYIEQDFALNPDGSFRQLVPGDWFTEETIFSNRRGWPSCGTIHSDRMILCGRDQIVMGRSQSRTDLNSARDDDDYGIAYRISSDRGNPDIRHVISGSHLEIYTKSSEFYMPIPFNQQVTPKNVSFREATGRGASSKVDPVQISNFTAFQISAIFQIT